MTHFKRNEVAERIRRIVQKVLSENYVEYWSLLVSLTAREAGPLQWRVAAMTSRGRIHLDLDAAAFRSEESFQREVAELVLRVLPRAKESDLRSHLTVYCWCGHSGDTPATERGSHYLGAPQDRLRGSALHCRECEAHPEGIEEKRQRSRATPCPACRGGYTWSGTTEERQQLCSECHGMGFLKPAWYEALAVSG